MPTRLRLTPPSDYVLARDACSYGYFLLAPNHWDPRELAYSTVLDLPAGPATLRITQPPRAARSEPPRHSYTSLRAFAGRPLAGEFSRTLSRPERAIAQQRIARMLRLDEPADVITSFHRADPRWRRSGRGRLMRSPTLFEDVIKTVTSCNVTWPSTVNMNRRLCEVVGRGRAFPSAQRLARTRPGLIRARCSVGYRDQRIIDLARLFSTSPRHGGIDQDWIQDPSTPDDALHEALLELPGVGPYAAANIMQLLGRYAHLPLDTESIRHGKTVLGFRGNARAIMRRVQSHFQPFGPHAFRSYWFEMWRFYESRRGPSWTWDRETTGKSFTAAQLG